MSSCLSGGGGSRTYRFELDIVKSASSVRSSSHASSPSSTLSDSSNAPRAISTKRPRTPRKRPNQTYNEAAALLSTIYPNIFSSRSLQKLCRHPRPYDSFSESSELLPAFPALSDTGFLIRDTPVASPTSQCEPKRMNSLKNICQRPLSMDFREPCLPAPNEDDDFDAESILDEEVGEGIDSIMGNLSMDNDDDNNNKSSKDSENYNAQINPLLGSLMGFGLAGRLEFGFGFGLGGVNMRQALRRADDWDWWRSPAVAIRDIVPKFKKLSAGEKKKKKVDKEEAKEVEASNTTATNMTSSSSQENLRPSLGLKLDYEDVLKSWSDRGCPYSDDPPESPESFVCF